MKNTLAENIYNVLTNNGFTVSLEVIHLILNENGTKADGDKNDIIESLRLCTTNDANELIKELATA